MAWNTPDDAAQWLGLDVGGANLKVADGRGEARSVPFALWKTPNGLGDAIRSLLQSTSNAEPEGIGLTMTGELADCYATKAEGVRAIVGATAEAAEGRPVRVATVEGRFVGPGTATNQPHQVAAANWAIAASLVGENSPTGRGLWIDVGSTTTDLIPIESGRLVASGVTDPERLISGELVYTGVRRTPICAVVRSLPYRGRECPVAAEWFATTADAWLLLGELSEDPHDATTADGRPLTREASIDRLARCVCADREGFGPADATAVAQRIAGEQVALLADAIRRVATLGADWVVLGGEGEFLARRALDAAGVDAERTSVSTHVGATVGSCLPAHAAAVLAARSLEGAG